MASCGDELQKTGALAETTRWTEWFRKIGQGTYICVNINMNEPSDKLLCFFKVILVWNDISGHVPKSIISTLPKDKLGRIISAYTRSRPLVRYMFCPMKIDHISRLTLYSGFC